MELKQGVVRLEEKVDRLLEAQGDRQIEELLEEIVHFPIEDADGFSLLEELLMTDTNYAKLVRPLNFNILSSILFHHYYYFVFVFFI